MFARKRYYSPILSEKESEGVKVWAYGKQAYEILGLVLDPDYGDITDPESGTDIVLTTHSRNSRIIPKDSIEATTTPIGLV